MPGSTKIRPTNDAIPPPCCEQSPWSDGEDPRIGFLLGIATDLAVAHGGARRSWADDVRSRRAARACVLSTARTGVPPREVPLRHSPSTGRGCLVARAPYHLVRVSLGRVRAVHR
jgi:hypothetical protein